MAEEKRNAVIPHNIVLEGRRLLTVSGVSDVDSFDEETVVVFTELGELTVKGSDLLMWVSLLLRAIYQHLFIRKIPIQAATADFSAECSDNGIYSGRCRANTDFSSFGRLWIFAWCSL